MAKIVAIIPARWGSTRFPGKPLHLIAGKPLLQHVWERCLKARRLSNTIIATDDIRIAEAAFDFGAEVSMTSPRHQSGTDRIAEVVKKMRGISHVINVQGDEPLIDPKLIDRLANALGEDAKIEMVTAATPFKNEERVENPNLVKVALDRASNALYFSRSVIPFPRDDAAPQFYRHQGIYGYRVSVLMSFITWKPTPLETAEKLEQLRALEHGIKIRVLIAKNGSIGVDTPEDAALVTRLLKK